MEDYYLEIIISTLPVVIANLITMMTPSKADNKILNVILTILNLVSLNIGKNKNADTVEKPKIEIPVRTELIKYWREGEWKKESHKSDDV
jgi:hypothetical protein